MFSRTAAFIILAIIVIALPATIYARSRNTTVHASNSASLPDGLQYTDTVVGTGPMPRTGDRVTVSYVGTFQDGRQFDASADHGGTFTFPIGEGQVIKGWDEGVATMRVGGERKLVVPPDLGYGTSGAGDTIPPNTTLLFTVKLISIGS